VLNPHQMPLALPGRSRPAMGEQVGVPALILSLGSLGSTLPVPDAPPPPPGWKLRVKIDEARACGRHGVCELRSRAHRNAVK